MSDTEKRLNVKLPGDKHELFRRACLRNETSMTEVIERFIDGYIAQNPVPARSSRK
jgi:hypothetical protein